MDDWILRVVSIVNLLIIIIRTNLLEVLLIYQFHTLISIITMETVQKITCVRSMQAKEFFKEALGQIFSEKYFSQQEKHVDQSVFVFQVETSSKTWSLFKQGGQISKLILGQEFKNKISKQTLQLVEKVKQQNLQRQGTTFQRGLGEICTAVHQALKMQFFQSGKTAYQSFMMRKLSGGRYRQSMCCKMGAIFQGWKERKVNIYLKGVGYYNEKGQLREFLSYSQGFYFQYGRPKTGKQFGITLYANHRKLSLQAKNIRDFIYFLFILRKTCEESCYMTLNRFNSFAPIRNGNNVKFLIDGQQYFEAVYQSIQKAKFNLMIMGWMLSPQFLLVRGDTKVSLQQALVAAAKRNVKILVILYHESCVLSNDSRYFKEKLESKNSNIKVLRHPCGKLPVLWSHHSKLVIIDERQGFLGGLDMCYGRFDNSGHQIFGDQVKYPGIQYNNIRINDEFQVRNPKFPSIMRTQPRLPWHDVGVKVSGKVVSDLVHHFYQLWHFVRYENKQQPNQNQKQYAASLFEVDVKSVFSTKVIPQEQPKNFMQKIQNGMTTLKKTLKKKGKQVVKKVKTQMNKLVPKQKQNQEIKIRVTAKQDYFEKYFKQVNQEILKKNNNQQKVLKKNDKGSKRRGSGISKRFSVDQIKQIKVCLQTDEVKQEGLRKTNSFLLSGDRIIDYMNIDIDKDYIECLQKINGKRQGNSSILIPENVQVQSEEDEQLSSQLYDGKIGQISSAEQGHDQCQVVRSVGNWSIGCHPNNTEFSIHISYLQLISQAKHFIYIENQFFISSTADSTSVKNQVAYALYLRILKAIQQNEDFRVYIILPLIPGFSGDLENEQCVVLRKEMQWQYDTICRSQNSIWQRLLTHTNDPGKYLQFFGLRNHGRYDETSEPLTQIIYLHSKLMIIDDEIVLCGSANINDRSLVGDRDSELALITRGEDFVEGVMNGDSCLVSQLAHELRVKLWAQHFGFPEQQILDPVCTETWEKILCRAQENTAIYRKVFGCYPDDEMQTRKKITKVREASNIHLYTTLKDEIKGNVVEFPLNFLADQPLTCLITEKEFYMPTECLT